MFENTVKILLTFAHLLYTAANSRTHLMVSFCDSAEITSCVHIETIIHLRLS